MKRTERVGRKKGRIGRGRSKVGEETGWEGLERYGKRKKKGK